MKRVRALLETLHPGALGVWLGALVMTGVTAAIAFPEMQALDPALPAFAAYSEDHGIIAAGHVMARVFAIADGVQLACAALAVFTMFILFAMRTPRRWWRLVFTLAPAGVFVWYVLFVAQPMHADLTGFWSAASEGNTAAADQLRASFDARHPVASRAMGAIAVLTLLALLVSGVTRKEPT